MAARTRAKKASAAAADAEAVEAAERPPFEASLEQLEGVVTKLEGGELSLEDSLQAFEDGVRLTRQCASRLDAAEQRIEVLAREGSKWVAEPFDPAGAAASEDEAEAEEV